MRNERRSKQLAVSEKQMPPPFLEVINKMQQPFVTVISDTIASKASFSHGNVLLVENALTPLRPRNALSSNKAAFDCLESKKALQGNITILEWEARVLRYAHINRLRAITWGAYFQD